MHFATDELVLLLSQISGILLLVCTMLLLGFRRIYIDAETKQPTEIEIPLIGQTNEYKSFFGTRTYYREFAMDAQVSMPITDALKIRLPDLIINDAKFVLPEILFKKDRSVEFFMPINC